MFNCRERALKKILCALEKHDYLHYNTISSETQQEAKLALCDFLSSLGKIKPDKRYKYGYVGHFSYLIYLLKIKLALQGEDYCLAIHEIYTLFHYEEGLQPRIYLNLQTILAEHLDKKE